jgi:signal transduction histidine kinase
MHRVYRPLRESISNLEEFTSNVNHEFKTSLSEIISSLELGEITKSQKEYAPQALSSAKRLNIILESLTPLVEYNNASYRREYRDVAALFRETLEEYATAIESKNIEIISHIPASLALYIDSGPLNICFSNILSNAIKYSHV